jgi:hypothetical protein
MLKACGRVVYLLSMPGGKSVSYTTTALLLGIACAQAYCFLNSLYHKCTQVLHCGFLIFSSVISGLYPLSTQPIKTTTF